MSTFINGVCKRGHIESEENVYFNQGRRRCRPCNRISSRRFDEKRREARRAISMTIGEMQLVSDLLTKAGAQYFAAALKPEAIHRLGPLELAEKYFKSAKEIIEKGNSSEKRGKET